MTELQLAVYAATFSIHMDRCVQSIDPRLDGDQRERFLERAGKLAATRAYEAARHVPGEA